MIVFLIYSHRWTSREPCWDLAATVANTSRVPTLSRAFKVVVAIPAGMAVKSLVSRSAPAWLHQSAAALLAAGSSQCRFYHMSWHRITFSKAHKRSRNSKLAKSFVRWTPKCHTEMQLTGYNLVLCDNRHGLCLYFLPRTLQKDANIGCVDGGLAAASLLSKLKQED